MRAFSLASLVFIALFSFALGYLAWTIGSAM